MSKDPEEATKEAARKAVTEGLTDPDTIRLLSAAGDAAKRSRPDSPLPRSRLQQQKQSAKEDDKDHNKVSNKVNETNKNKQEPSG